MSRHPVHTVTGNIKSKGGQNHGIIGEDGTRRSSTGTKRFVAAAAVVMIVSLLGGCAKFSASRKMDPGPFGENVTVMMGDVSR